MDHNRERGMTLIHLALVIGALMGIAALALDLGVAYTAHTSAQHAADAGALAGASSFRNPSNPQPATAQNYAIAAAATNTVLGKPVTITAADVIVYATAEPPYVTVTVPLTGANSLTTYFARIFGIDSMGVVAQATAEAWDEGTASMCLKPIFIPNTILSLQAPAAACASHEVIFQNNGGTYSYSQWASGNHLIPMSPSSLPVSIKPANPQDALAPSQFYSMNLAQNPPGGGASIYNCTLGYCMSECPGALDAAVACGDSYPVETGAMIGPTRQGVTTLIGNPPDTYAGPGQYRSGIDGNLYDTSRSLALAPIWDNCTQQISPGYNGQAVKIVGFVEMFVVGMNGNSVEVYFVKPVGCAPGGISGPGGGPLTGPLGQPIHLIQTPVP